MDETHQPLANEPQTSSLPTRLAAAQAPDGHSNRSALLIVFMVVFVDLLGFGIVLPLLPLYAKDLLIPLMPGSAHRPTRGLILGLLLSSFSAMQFLFAPIWGRISDSVGRRPILLMGLAGSVVFYSLFGLASEVGATGQETLGLVLLFLSRLGAGMAGATISTAQAVIADTTTPERRSRGMALIGAAFGIGFTFGPLLGFASLFVPAAGAPGFAAAGFSLLALLLAMRLLPETRSAGGPSQRRRWLDWAGLRTALRTPSVGVLILTFFLATFAFGGLESTLAFVNQLLLYPELEVSREQAEALINPEMMRKNLLVFAYVGFVLMLTQGLFYRRLVQRVGEVPFLRIGVILMGLGLGGAVGVLLVRETLSSRATLLVSALLVMTVAVVGFACLTPSVQALISRRTDPNRQGEILGANQSAAALARILGPLVGVSLFFLTPAHILPYAFGAALLAVVFILALRIARTETPGP
jgi:MFS family permease